MTPETELLVRKIHNMPGKVVIVTAGAGSMALHWLLGVAGASRTLLEATIPYDSAAFRRYLQRTPARHVELETAGLLAGRALQRAWSLEQTDEPLVGLSCSATVITDRPKKGAHRAHIAAWQRNQVYWASIHLKKGARDRQGEEELVSKVILNTLALSYGLEETLSLDLVRGDRLTTGGNDILAAIERLKSGSLDQFLLQPYGELVEDGNRPEVLLAGSFDPLHSGHRKLAAVAAQLSDGPAAFEISVTNVDKEPLSSEVITRRLAQFAGDWPVLVTSAPTFLEKARLLPGATFAVGYDTAERLLNPSYYGYSLQNLRSALTEIGELGCSFLVAGRTNASGHFRDATKLPLPLGFQHLFKTISEESFRTDLSSTELRARRKGR